MTNEELNTALYKKVFAEQEKYREWLLSQPPDEILNHCYEYTVREDIVLALEESECSSGFYGVELHRRADFQHAHSGRRSEDGRPTCEGDDGYLIRN